MPSFKEFNLSENMVRCLRKQGYVEPSPVQRAVIPKALRGVSLLAQSATGTGKTHAYLIPLIERTDVNLHRLQSIIIAPTRELARQIYAFATAFQPYYPKFKVRLFSSEAEASENAEGLSTAPQMVIGTPGRLRDILIERRLLDLRNVRSVVLDEADMLMDMGYFEDIEAIFAALKKPQTLVFSATLKQNLRDELRKFVRSDFEFEAEEKKTASTVRHHFVDIKHADPKEALVSFLSIRKPYLCLVFASKKEDVAAAYRYARDNGVDAILFTGDLGDRSRKKALREIRSGEHQVIISSDILARGMDIEDVTDVVSLDLPGDLEFYFHRAGRTGRFGKEGDSWVFYDDDHKERALALLPSLESPDFKILRGGVLKDDPVGLLPKKKLKAKKDFLSEDEKRDVKIAKARARTKGVKPGYKKKRREAVEKVKRKYKRKAIEKSVRRELMRKSKEESGK
jgi:ATP-dependent RNA helicase CshB